jgi:hypothetical protein
LSLVALDDLEWCVCSGRKPALLNPPAPQEFVATLDAHLATDNVPRVRETVRRLLEAGHAGQNKSTSPPRLRR